ncbi:MAG: cytochrome c-type biogenesis protein [Hyphomonadaceae bacterium]
MKRLILVLLLPFLLAFSDAPLPDAKLEARALALMDEIRCVACENEPISQSGAEIAADMRQRVRMMIASGESDAAVRSWFTDRYGEFVLFRPQATGTSGILLWGLPFGVLLFGGLGLVLVVRGRAKVRDGVEVTPVEPDAFDGVADHKSASEN